MKRLIGQKLKYKYYNWEIFVIHYKGGNASMLHTFSYSNVKIMLWLLSISLLVV